MTNTSNRKGFKQVDSKNTRDAVMKLAASYTGQDGDEIYMGSDGNPTNTRNSAYPIIGVQKGSILDKDDLSVKSTSEAGDFVHLADPTQVFVGEIATGALTDPYTTYTAAAAFDVAGSAGAKYINQAASTYDQIQVLGPASEDIPDDGTFSEVGENMKVKFRFNQAKVLPVTSNYVQLK
jgi:hypothetical protein